ncbi:MAG: glycosyltransferase family 2 protein [Candidatus Woesebacteria bacterium]|nr:MAG: glycosyltransferase family 2 protein [Candidatus Woesebacteria bacterium]
MKLDPKSWQVPEYKINEFFKKRNKYSLITPVLNEGKRIKDQLQKMKKYSKMVDIILVDGGSTDGSTNKTFLKRQGLRAVINTPRGQSVQMRAGLAWALKQKYEGIITIDGNNKDDVSAIPLFIKALDEGCDYAQASRFLKGGKHKNTPSDRIFFNRFVISPVLSLAAGKWYTDTPLAFRAYSKDYLLHPGVKPFRDIFQRYELLFYMTTRANRLGLKSKEIPTTRNYPKGEVPTKIVGWKKINDLLNIFKIVLGFYNP